MGAVRTAAFQAAARGEPAKWSATDRSAPVPGRSNVGSLAVWEQSQASSRTSLAAAALRQISSQLANDFDDCSAENGEHSTPKIKHPTSELRWICPGMLDDSSLSVAAWPRCNR
jgi:hypothetical protein